MLAGIPGPGFLIFRAGRVIEVPRTPLEAIAVATGISRKYLRISQNISEHLERSLVGTSQQKTRIYQNISKDLSSEYL